MQLLVLHPAVKRIWIMGIGLNYADWFQQSKGLGRGTIGKKKMQIQVQ